tara:strand:+ start:1865 stop:2923 length:1059 start_codon:yes stop_codon:yes gene_type:complete
MPKKKALIIGITGQDGSYLAEILLNKNYIVHGMVRRSSMPNTQRIDHILPTSRDNEKLNQKVIREYGDLSSSGQIQNLIKRVKPDEIYNLGAQSHVRVSFEIPEYTYDIVGIGPLRVLEAIKNIKPNTKYIQASSSEMFGNSKKNLQDEETKFKPESPYASAKTLGYWTTKNYRDNFKIFASNAIMFNHESPRRGINFVTKKIVRGLCEIKRKKRGILYLGNLNAKRDWGYAKEYCEILWKILQLNKPNDFVLATGKNYSVRDFVEATGRELNMNIIWKGSGLKEVGYETKSKKIIIKVDPYFFRPNDVQSLLGNSSKLYKEMKLKPKTSFNQLVKIMVKNEIKLIKESKLY